MKKQILDKWIKNLTNGKYKQTAFALRRESGFCCLGVLTDMYIKKHGLNWDYVKDGACKFTGESNMLPQVVAEWAEFDKNILIDTSDDLKSSLPVYDIKLKMIINDIQHEDITSANDYGETFSNIAAALNTQIITH